MTKKVLITVGGTGGHIYPAIALAKQLRKECPNIELMFIGGALSSNRYFDRESFPYKTVACGSFVKKNPLTLSQNFGRIVLGTWQSYGIIRNYRPNLLVGFGSYYTLPTLMAARLASIPIILHEANSIPGKVNRLMSSHAKMTGIHFPETAGLLKGKTIEVGMPLREGYALDCVKKEHAREYFGLDSNLPTLLIFGGSQGAKAINTLASEAITGHLKNYFKNLQVMHFTGDSKISAEIRKKYDICGIRACVKDFEQRMDLAWRASDLMISRAGAGTIAEETEFEVPGILIPYPHAADNHQNNNAEFMAKTVGGAIKFLEADLNSSILAKSIESLISNKQAKLNEMKESIKSYKKHSRVKDLCSLVIENLQQ